jgi:hypothetical protein
MIRELNRLGDLLPLRLGTAQAALRAVEAMQAFQTYRRLPDPVGCTQVECLTALSGKGWWRLAGSPSVMHAMNNQWFEELGLVNLVQRYATLQA